MWDTGKDTLFPISFVSAEISVTCHGTSLLLQMLRLSRPHIQNAESGAVADVAVAKCFIFFFLLSDNCADW